MGAVVPVHGPGEAEGLRLHPPAPAQAAVAAARAERAEPPPAAASPRRRTKAGSGGGGGGGGVSGSCSGGSGNGASVGSGESSGGGEYEAPAPPPRAVVGAALVAKAEGLRLHLSSSSATGYRGVFKNGSRFQAKQQVDGRQVCYGYFGTAVEAAVAYARAVGEDTPAVAAEPAVVAAEAEVVAEAEGLRLHLSSNSATGYKGVHEQSGRFQAKHKVDRRNQSLGFFGTAVEAAVAYARAVGAPPAVAAEAEGLRLHLSSSSATGYKGVYTSGRGVYGSRFRAQHTVGRETVCYGYFGTAVEAAVAYARAVGEAPGQAEVAAAAAARAAEAQAVEAACSAARAGCPVQDTSTTRPGHAP